MVASLGCWQHSRQHHASTKAIIIIKCVPRIVPRHASLLVAAAQAILAPNRFTHRVRVNAMQHTMHA